MKILATTQHTGKNGDTDENGIYNQRVTISKKINENNRG